MTIVEDRMAFGMTNSQMTNDQGKMKVLLWSLVIGIWSLIRHFHGIERRSLSINFAHDNIERADDRRNICDQTALA